MTNQEKSNIYFCTPEIHEHATLTLLKVIQQLLLNRSVSEQLLATQQPNSEFTAYITRVRKWVDKSGILMINITYEINELELPFPMGLQFKPWHRSYSVMAALPDGYQGEIKFKLNDNGDVTHLVALEFQTEDI